MLIFRDSDEMDSATEADSDVWLAYRWGNAQRNVYSLTQEDIHHVNQSLKQSILARRQTLSYPASQ